MRLPSQAGHRTPWCRGYSSYIRHAFSVASQAKTSNPPLDVVTVTAGVVAFMALGPRPRVHLTIEADLQVSWRPCAAAKAASSTALPYRTFRPSGYCAEFHSAASGFDGQGKRHQVVNLRAKARYAIATLTVQRARSSCFRGLPARRYPSEPFCAHRLLPAFAQAVAPSTVPRSGAPRAFVSGKLPASCALCCTQSPSCTTSPHLAASEQGATILQRSLALRPRSRGDFRKVFWQCAAPIEIAG